MSERYYPFLTKLTVLKILGSFPFIGNRKGGDSPARGRHGVAINRDHDGQCDEDFTPAGARRNFLRGVNMRFVKPLDRALLDNVASHFHNVVTVEDDTISGGFGSAVAEYYAAKQFAHIRLKIHGIPDRFIDHGTLAELQKELFLDPPGIAAVVKEFVDHTPSKKLHSVEALAKGQVSR